MRPTTEVKSEDLGYFYDTIHGRVAFGELPSEFQPALRAVLSSRALDRLTRISQLGHTSLTYFSATQTRFSHAIGTLLMMNRLFRHVFSDGSVTRKVLDDCKKFYPKSFKICEDRSDSIRCHLLLAALFQDCGELPFQKITSLYIRPRIDEVDSLRTKLDDDSVLEWKTKDVFTLRALSETLDDAGLFAYDLKFLAFLITGSGCPKESPIQALRLMADGPIDADRLDYVFRDALLTIGSVNRADAVLNSIIRYEPDHVVVDDPRPAADFLATRARLWTFVYTSPDVRFRQALLRSFLQAGFSDEDGKSIFKDAKFFPEVTLSEFLELDDHSMLQRIRKVSEHDQFSRFRDSGKKACSLLLKTVTDYECRILQKPNSTEGNDGQPKLRIPKDLFFDLLADHDEEHKLYLPGSVRVDQSLTRSLESAVVPFALEDCSGALGPIFLKENRAPLVRSSFFIFCPKKGGQEWDAVEDAIRDNHLFDALDREDIDREINSLTDTWHKPGFKGKRIAISCAFQDRTTILRVIRGLQAQKQRYRVLLDSLLGLGNTSLKNSEDLIQEAEAVIVIASKAYLRQKIEKPDGNIAAEVRQICGRNTNKSVMPLEVFAVDTYETLTGVTGWSWQDLNPKWRSGPPILIGMRYAGESKLKEVLENMIDQINRTS